MTEATATSARIVKSGPLGEMTPDSFIWQVEVEVIIRGDDSPVRGIGTTEWNRIFRADDPMYRVEDAEMKALSRAIRHAIAIASMIRREGRRHA